MCQSRQNAWDLERKRVAYMRHFQIMGAVSSLKLERTRKKSFNIYEQNLKLFLPVSTHHFLSFESNESERF